MAEDSYASDQEMPYSVEELENLQQIFALFDRDRSGRIDIADVQEIMKQLNRNPEEGRRYSAAALLRDAEIEDEGRLSFEEFVKLLAQVEQTLAADDKDAPDHSASALGENPMIRLGEDAAPDGKVVDFLR
jgi:Ca2+-binding EF-hand superfamily protein